MALLRFQKQKHSIPNYKSYLELPSYFITLINCLEIETRRQESKIHFEALIQGLFKSERFTLARVQKE